MIDISDFDARIDSGAYSFYTHLYQQSLFIITGQYEKAITTPNSSKLHISAYSTVIVQLSMTKANYPAIKSYDNYIHFVDMSTNIYLLPIDQARIMIDKYLDKVTTESIEICHEIKPCYKCGLMDKWNSLGKNNNWYCYQHCSY